MKGLFNSSSVALSDGLRLMPKVKKKFPILVTSASVTSQFVLLTKKKKVFGH